MSVAGLTSVAGTAQALDSCLDVQWVWISLPAALLALTVVSLGVAMGMTWRSGHWRGDWGTSSLPLLFYGLDMNVGGEKRVSDGLGGMMLWHRDMVDVAAQINVQLRRGEDGWRFYRT